MDQPLVVDPKLAPTSHRTRAHKLGRALAGVAVGLLASWWVFPGLADRLVYGQVDGGCEARMTLRGDTGDGWTFGRHCRVGTSTHETESGTFVSFEYARDGQVLLWSAGRPAEDGGEVPLRFALVRTPGDEGQWLCAPGGRWRQPSAGRNEVELAGVSVILDEAEASGDGTLSSRGDVLALTLGERTGAGTRGGWGCSNRSSRCELSGSLAGQPGGVRAVVRADDQGAVAHGFVLVEDARAPSQVQLAVTRAGTLARPDHDPEVELRGLSAPVACPSAGPGLGELKLRW